MQDGYVVDQEKFYGPLELLLYLVEKNQVDVTEISIAALADQFVAYLASAAEIELAAVTGFLKTASVLLRLKARLLLPEPPRSLREAEDETGDGGDDDLLVARLLEYRQFKLAAETLKNRQTGLLERSFYRPLAEEEREAAYYGRAESLRLALERLAERGQKPVPFMAPEREVSVEGKIEETMRHLRAAGGRAAFSHLAETLGSARREVAALFLGVLALAQEQKVILQQTAYLEDIMITLR
jgi:segregation and condensation protein A